LELPDFILFFSRSREKSVFNGNFTCCRLGHKACLGEAKPLEQVTPRFCQ
jgi:hypothetical protein